MKSPFHLSLVAVAALAVTALVTSCAGVFTKDDARDLGSFVAKESVKIAKLALTGDDSWKAAAADLGLDTAGLALEKITGNLTAPSPILPAPPPSTQPETLLARAAVVAEQEISAATNDPATASMAQYIACQACNTAKAVVSSNADGKTAFPVTPGA